jgi:hypothetical protein
VQNGLCRMLHKEECCDLYSQPCIVCVAVWKILWPIGYIVHVGAIRHIYTEFWWGKPILKQSIIKQWRLNWVDNTKLVHWEIDYMKWSGSESCPVMFAC